MLVNPWGVEPLDPRAVDLQKANTQIPPGPAGPPKKEFRPFLFESGSHQGLARHGLAPAPPAEPPPSGKNHSTTEIPQKVETERFGEGDSGNPGRTLAALKCPRAVAVSPRRLAARASFCSCWRRPRSAGTELGSGLGSGQGSGEGSGAGGGSAGAGGCTGGSGLTGGGGPGAPPPFPRATGGGISAWSICFPFCTESSICSRVWGQNGTGETVKIWRDGVKWGDRTGSAARKWGKTELRTEGKGRDGLELNK